MKIKARFDRLITASHKDSDTGEVITRAETYHFVFGKLGSDFSGGLYIKKGVTIPDILEIEIPETVKKEERHEHS
jgi:hypothetical protein